MAILEKYPISLFFREFDCFYSILILALPQGEDLEFAFKFNHFCQRHN
jgi:hypothetical protein